MTLLTPGEVFGPLEKTLKTFVLSQLVNLEQNFGEGTGEVKFKLILDAAQPYVLGLVNTAEAAIPVAGTLLNTDQIDALESGVYDSLEVKLATFLAHGIQNMVDALKSLPILKF